MFLFERDFCSFLLNFLSYFCFLIYTIIKRGRNMCYPSVFDNKTNKRHIVKDQHYCECGVKYNVFYTFTRKDLKRIEFKPLQDITCPECRFLYLFRLNQNDDQNKKQHVFA
jgi:hypothetical protein